VEWRVLYTALFTSSLQESPSTIVTTRLTNQPLNPIIVFQLINISERMAQKLNIRILSLFAFIVVSWGLAWPVNKVGLAYLSPVWFTAIRLMVGTVTMMALVIAVKQFSLPTRKDIPLILIIGLLQISIYILLTNLGLAYLPAGRSSLLAYTTPLWVMPPAILIFHEEAGFLKWAGFVLGIGGLLLLMSPWEMNWHDGNVIFGSAMLLLASLCWAISILCIRYMHWSKSPLELIPWQLLIGALPILLYAWIKEPIVNVDWNMPLILSLAYTGFLVTGLSYWSGIVINKELPASVLSLGFLAVPVFSLIISATWMGEAISVSTMAAMILILAGLVCIAV